MKIYAISDLHLSINNPKPMDIFGGAWDNYVELITDDWKNKVNENDIVLIAGDISWAMNLALAMPDLDFIGALSGKKVILRGNHDYWWKSITTIRQALPVGMYAVQNDCVRIGDVLVCGSRGWTTPEGGNQSAEDKAIYDREIIRMTLSMQSMQKMRKDTDKVIALCHYPPFNSRFDETPFTTLFSDSRVDAVVYGHLHGQNSRVCRNITINNINYFLTSCDLVGNKLVEILQA